MAKIASFARDTIHIPYTQSVNLVIVINGVGLPARILPGFIADRYTGVLNLFVPIMMLNTLLLYCWLAVHSISSFYVWTVLYGIAAGMFQSLFPTAVTSLSDDLSKAGTRLGMAFSVIGFAALVGGPIGGALVGEGDGNYKGAIIWAATSTFAGGACIAAARVWKYGFVLKVKC
jgi:MFS family permease